tara:strand:+ start:13859 stop:14338 length:480 start_codon:yes stop_codon:yes gene_type:complete
MILRLNTLDKRAMNTMTLGEQARKFREIFKQECLENLSRFGFIKTLLWRMQIGLIKEEASEFLEAADQLYADPENVKRREELVKELSDLVFVCYQFASAFNINLDKAMQLVYESNLTKLDDNGNPIFRPDGKVLKGPNYVAPNLFDCAPKPHPYFENND